MEVLERVITTRPKFHANETEIQRSFDPGESLLPEAQARRLASSGLTCCGIGEDVLRFLAESVGEGQRTLETGAGCSTLVFALRKARHTAVTPSEVEIRLIREYADTNGIGLADVTFVPEPSERYLPQSDESNLNLILLDGKHAFPWPMVDWFFTADRLKRGGLAAWRARRPSKAACARQRQGPCRGPCERPTSCRRSCGRTPTPGQPS